MARLKSKVSGPPQKPAGRVSVPMGWDRCDQSGSLRGMCEGAVTEPRPELTKRDWEAQDPPRKPGTSLLVPGTKEPRIGPGIPEPMTDARPVLLLTFAKERFQFDLCPTF